MYSPNTYELLVFSFNQQKPKKKKKKKKKDIELSETVAQSVGTVEYIDCASPEW